MNRIGVLFAHPNGDVRIGADEALEKAGFRSRTEHDGLDIKYWLDDDHEDLFRVVVVARHMPRLDGLALLRHVRENPRLQSVPVIVFDEYADVKAAVEELGAIFIQRGARFFDDLVDAVRQASLA